MISDRNSVKMSADHTDSVPNGDCPHLPIPNGLPSPARTDDADILAANTHSLSLQDSSFHSTGRENLTMNGEVPTKEEENRKLLKKTADSHASLYRQDSDKQLPGLALAYRSIIRGVGEDVNRQGLKKTPDRAAKAMMFFTKGYEEKIEGKYFWGNNFIVVDYFLFLRGGGRGRGGL